MRLGLVLGLLVQEQVLAVVGSLLVLTCFLLVLTGFLLVQGQVLAVVGSLLVLAGSLLVRGQMLAVGSLMALFAGFLEVGWWWGVELGVVGGVVGDVAVGFVATSAGKVWQVPLLVLLVK